MTRRFSIRKESFPPWLRYRDSDGVVLCARIRLARNVAGHAFPGWAGEEETKTLGRELEKRVGALPVFQGGTLYRMETIGPVERMWLRECQLISADLASRGEGSAVWISEGQTVSVMINEEDHLRIQVFGPVGEWDRLWTIADALDTALGEGVSYAFSKRRGFLTACPTNLGTGLRASVLMHLPGLILQREMGPVVKALQRLDYTVRGFLGEGTDMWGNMVQVSNQITWGRSEREILRDFEPVVAELVQKEQWARDRLKEGGAEKGVVEDQVIRAAAVLSYALRLSSEEALHHLSMLQLAQSYGWMKNLSREALEGLYGFALTGHLQKAVGRGYSLKDWDFVRAFHMRARMIELGILDSLSQQR